MPIALKRLMGNPGHENLNRAELKPRPVAPDCPAWLDRTAKAEWRRVAPELDRLGLLTCIDQAGLANYCSLYSTIVQCEKALRHGGYTTELREPSTTDADGNVKLGPVRYIQQRPEVAIRHKAILGIRAYCCEFGMTPSARSRMAILGNPADEDDEDSPFDI